jgi:tetratricopeptide (TPR) repeat protein
MDIASPPSDYPVIFRGYIEKSVQCLLTQVEQAEPIIPPDDVEQALHTLSFALKLPEAWPNVREFLISIAPKMEHAGYRDEWIPYLTQGVEQCEVLGDTAAAAELRLQLGILYQLRSKYALAREQFEASATGFQQLGAHRNQARALNQLAYVARLQREFDEATSLVEIAKQLLEAQDGERAFSYYVLGLVALDKYIWQEAVDFSKMAFDLWSITDNRRMISSA